ncbi:AT-rich interactive domain-containing protein 5A [Thalassophryne amazonica]|uniref:AT-rich interactive domain-containing protein 5A n=1 Tax=Thalassophryne amazonica TaxID=390379 RepID=UPI001471FCD7|nr:AT-rich interactive domain-containing protein 5A [Thalassophryne amazonica]
MAEEEQSDTSRQTSTSDDDSQAVTQTLPSVIEIHDSTTECEEETKLSPIQMEKSFVSSLQSFMKDRGTPIERIPHLGFKQINLWRIYKAVENLGGYDSVTAQRLWKKVYDELGGSPGSTSAATCTRRHYERLVLPYERHLRGEDDKPLPPTKPRKPYKRSQDGKMNQRKRKRSQSDREVASEILTKRSTKPSCQSEAGRLATSTLWTATSDRHHPESSQQNKGSSDICTSVCACSCLLQVPASSPWTGHIPSAAGEVISPLEKKKRVAQASLKLLLSPHAEDKERPSVIHCSQSPVLASSVQNCNSPEGSPLPLSSSSSRSPSPYSVSSEDSTSVTEDKSTRSTELSHNCSSAIKKISGSSENSKSPICSQASRNLTGQTKDVSHVSSQSLNTNSNKSQSKDSAGKQIHKGNDRYFTHQYLFPTPSGPSFTGWTPTSTSSFTKVSPQSVQILRPAPIHPVGYKIHQSRMTQQDDPLSCADKLNSVSPWSYQTDKREKSRTTSAKAVSAQQSLSSSAALPMSCVLSGYDKPGRDTRHQPPFHPAFLHSRLTQTQPVYRHFPMAAGHSALIGSTVYSYPYTIPLFSSPPRYNAVNSVYPHKL